MLKNHFLIAFRNLLRHKLYSFINIFGLAVGLAACLLIFLFVEHELSFDAFHSQKEHVYRLNEVQTWDGIIPQNVALSMYPMAPTLKQDYPEVETYTRLLRRNNFPLRNGDKKMYAEKFYLVDSAFFEVFDFELLFGDPSIALEKPMSMVISEETAMNLFSTHVLADVVGKSVRVESDDTLTFTISAVMKNVPKNSHLQFDGLISLNSFPEQNKNWMGNWGSNWLNTYLKMVPGTDIAALESKFPDYLVKYMGEDATDGYQLFLQPLTDIHLGSANITHDDQNIGKFNGKYIYTFLFLALFVLLIAGINFMNLTTARSIQRIKEVGVRKTIGASRGHLARQFISESVFFAGFALVLALIITALTLPFLNDLSLREMSMANLLTPSRLAVILGVTFLVGILGGLYPAFFMASFQPVKALKGKVFLRNQRFSLQNVLVVLQFVIAIAMIVGTLLTTRQLRHMIDMDPGFNTDQVMLLPAYQKIIENYEPFKNALSQHTAIKGVSASGQRLGGNIHQTGIRFKVDTAEQSLAISHVNVDYDFIDFYDIELKDGRSFSKEFSKDAEHGFIINERLAKKMGVEDPVGMPMKFGWHEEWGKVIGLAKDFNYNSLHHDINPLAMSVQPNWGFSEVSIRVDAKKLQTVLPHIQAQWEATGTDHPFDYEFLDTHFAQLYRTDQQVSQIVGIIAGLAILIACMGLFGLVSVSTEKRTKEIGIRKVLGASIPDVLFMLSKGVAAMVLIAFLISVPLTWWFMNDWLSSFAYRIPVGAGVFFAAGGLTFLVALATISYLAFRAARRNPIEALRYE